MTRESLKEYYMQIADAPSPSNRWLPEIVCEQIDLIYDDLESRTCENCKYFNRIGACSNKESAVYDKLVWDTFGCTEFERIEL